MTIAPNDNMLFPHVAWSSQHIAGLSSAMTFACFQRSLDLDSLWQRVEHVRAQFPVAKCSRPSDTLDPARRHGEREDVLIGTQVSSLYTSFKFPDHVSASRPCKMPLLIIQQVTWSLD